MMVSERSLLLLLFRLRVRQLAVQTRPRGRPLRAPDWRRVDIEALEAGYSLAYRSMERSGM